MFKQAAKSGLAHLALMRNKFANIIDPPTIVLAYHRVTSLTDDPHQLAVEPENFRQQLAFLKKQFKRIVRFDGNWEGKGPAVCLTFDDGYADNYLTALPILEEYDMSATVFVTTGHVGTLDEFWWDELERILLHQLDLPQEPIPVCGSLSDVSARMDTNKLRLFNAVHSQLRSMPPEERNAWLEKLRTWAGISSKGRDSHRSVSLFELQQLAKHPLICIGAHTHLHPCLSSLDYQDQFTEIERSKKLLEEWLSIPIEVFAYPFGARGLLGRSGDYNGTSMRICKELGFKRAAANYSGQAHFWTNKYAIPRHLVRDWSTIDFSHHLRGFFEAGSL